jgi:hypothetical protein
MKTTATTLNPELLRDPGADWRQANHPPAPAHSDELLEARHWDWGKTK